METDDIRSLISIIYFAIILGSFYVVYHRLNTLYKKAVRTLRQEGRYTESTPQGFAKTRWQAMGGMTVGVVMGSLVFGLVGGAITSLIVMFLFLIVLSKLESEMDS